MKVIGVLLDRDRCDYSGTSYTVWSQRVPFLDISAKSTRAKHDEVDIIETHIRQLPFQLPPPSFQLSEVCRRDVLWCGWYVDEAWQQNVCVCVCVCVYERRERGMVSA